MPGKDRVNPSDVYKTSAVVSFSQLLMLPLRMPTGPATLVIALGLYGLHEIGKARHADTGWKPSLFAPKVAPDISAQSIAKNVCKGGAVVFDWFAPDNT